MCVVWVEVRADHRSWHCSGSSLPALEELRCVESVVPCVRDLGTSLSGLVVLWLPQCQLRDLDGLPALTALRVSGPPLDTPPTLSLLPPPPPPLPRGSVCGQWLCSLQELYIAFNEVRDVSVAAMLPCLQLLDIERCVFM